MKSFPIIETSRLVLRQFVPADLENVYKGLSNPAVIKYYGVSYDSLEATKAQMDWFSDLEKDGKGIWWAICLKENVTFVGGGGFNEWDQTNQKAEIGFWLYPEFWGQGIMTEAMPLIVKYGFTGMNLHRIEGFVESNNQNCKRGLAKLNFKYEGTMKDCELKDNQWMSVDIYAQINDKNP